jgi:hypothetical protein
MSKSNGRLLTFGLIIVCLAGLVSCDDSDSVADHPASITGRDAADVLISRCGKPDVDDSTAYDKPRPPAPMRWVEYRKAQVKVLFVPDGPLGAAPPYRWKFFAVADLRTQKPLDSNEAIRRLPCVQSK